MSIEKMTMLNMVGHIGDIDRVSKALVLAGCVQPISAMHEIDTTDFTFKTTEANLDVLVDVCYIRPYSSEIDYSQLQSKMEKLRSICSDEDIEGKFNKRLIEDFLVLQHSIITTTSNLEGIYDSLQYKKKEKEQITEALEHLKFVKDLNISMGDLNNLKNLSFKLFKISADNIKRLRGNYENIPSITISIYKDVDYEIIMAFTPYIFKAEADRIFKSLNCETVSLTYAEEGTPEEIRKVLFERLANVIDDIKKLDFRLKEAVKENNKIINILDKSLQLELKSNRIKNTMACTKEFFYFSGWVPYKELKKVKKSLEFCEERLIFTEKAAKEVTKTITPPTSMKNNIIFRPFESMVTMYGIPSYRELDPTSFLAISYMILFGAMFGDVGQGFVFALAGIYLMVKKRRPNLGGVIFRLGISSIIFGFAYGSVFGDEEIIHALVFRPMEEIMTTLVYGVIFGCLLLSVGYIYSLINNYRKGNLEKGIFSKDGLVGFIFFISLLTFGYTKYASIEIVPNTIWYLIFIISLVLMLLKEPLSNLILNKRPLYSESKQDYFIEGGFGIVETLISLLSNTLSFIRVGAFALNHVGLFMAFKALGDMMQGSGSIIMYVLGNVIILGLEGLIVFIQGLRLEYYELFSKYFEGGGTTFEPIMITKSFKN